MLSNGAKLKNKGQFYLMTAAILCLATFTAVSTINIPKVEKNQKFNDLANNFIIEAPKVINYATNYDFNITQTFEYFEEDYINYLKSQDSEMGIIYIIHHYDSIYVKNLNNQTIKVNNNFFTRDVRYQEMLILPLSTQIKILIDENEYVFEISENEPIELKLLFINKKEA